MSSFQTALSSLKASSTAIDVVGNNLANINTTGFKRSSVAFQDLVNSLGTSATDQIGAGVQAPFVNRQFAQGNVSGTDNSMDAAIQGNGLFVIKSASLGAADAQQYTRDGQFHVSPTGLLVTANDARVQGWNADPATGVVNTTGAVANIAIPAGTVIPPVPTTGIEIAANFDAEADQGDSLAIPLQLIDATGGGHQFSLTATKSATANQWDLSLSTTDPTVQDGANLTSKLSVGSLSFTNGILDPATASQITISGIQFTPESGIQGMADINWNVWKVQPSGTPPTGGVSGLTQFSQTSVINKLSQNGSPAGTQSDVRIGANGAVIATFSNGLERQIAQIAVAVAQNPDSLIAMGDNTYQASVDTKILPPSVPGSGAGGSIVAGSVEASNVDIAQEFANLITYQRTYQASSRVITTVDQLTMETLALKQ